MLTIGLIDSYALMRKGLSIILNDHFENVEVLESNDIAEFGRLYEQKRPDLMIMGINLTTKDDCLDMVNQLKKRFPAIPLVVYDEHLRLNLTIPYFKLGISGYLLKQNSAAEMINCVDAVLSKKQYLCPALLEVMLKFFSKPHYGQQKSISLTRRESEIAKYLSQGMKTSWIAETLGRKPSTISTIKNNIFKKMKVENIMELRKVIHVDFA
jgi:DNA-binding NarL/FixJ family response regulator